jgi:hypothetical protein
MIPAILAGGAIVTGLATAYIGAQEGKKGRQAAKDYQNEISDALNAISIPELQELALKDPKWLGNIQPFLSEEKFKALDLPEDITTDPKFRQAQMDTMETLKTVSKEGMTAEDKLNLENISQRADRDSSSSRKATMQAMAERGMGGAGMELAQNLQAEQGLAQRRGMEGLQLASDKRKAALNAMMQRGNMATGMRNQEFGEKQANQGARMAREEFNKRMAMDVQRANVDAQNRALYRDMDLRQQAENADAERRDREEIYNIGRDERKYQMEMDKVRAKAGIADSQSAIAQREAAAKANQWGQLQGAIEAGAGAYGKYDAAKKKPGG